jgi:Transposase DDE domain group 1
VQSTAWSRDLRITADGIGVVSHVGAALLRMLADRAGLTAALSGGLARVGWWPVHDRGRVLVDLAVLIADGGEAIADIDVLRHQGEVFGPVASDTTAWRALDEIGAAQLRRIAKARAAVRTRMWRLFGGPPPAKAAGRDIGAGVVVLDVDSTIVIAHSDKESAAATYKHSFGFHPILVTCDNTSELLAIRLRPGNAGANTATDHLDVLAEAIAQVPAQHRRHLLIRGDSAAATHSVLDWLTAQNTARRRVEYSIGWSIGAAERAAIGTLPAQAWSPALAADGDLRDGADVAELTGLLTLPGWPAGMRVIVRRERPHPGAQLSLFEERDGWRYIRHQHCGRGAAVAGGPAPGARSGGGPDPLRQGHRPAPAPVPGVRHQPGLVRRRRDRRGPDLLAADPRPGRRTGPRRAETAALSPAAHRRPADPRATPPLAAHPVELALGHPDHRRVHPDRGHPRPRLTSHSRHPNDRRNQETTPTAATDGFSPCPGHASHRHSSIMAARPTELAHRANHRGQSVIAIETAVTGVLLFQTHFFETEKDAPGRSGPDPRLRLLMLLVLTATVFGSLEAIRERGGLWAAVLVTVGLAISVLPILLRVLPPLRRDAQTKQRDPQF